MRHDVSASLLDMIGASQRAADRAAKTDLETFLTDEDAKWFIWSQFVLLGEAGNRIPESFREGNPEIPWHLIRGMRNRILHGYDSTDWESIFKTAKDDLPPIVVNLKTLWEEMRGENLPSDSQ